MLVSERRVRQEKEQTLSLCPPITEKTTMNINISGRCNQQCIYCLYHHIGAHKKGCLIDDDLFYRVTREAYELGVREIGLYTSGEPLLHPGVYKYIAYLKKLGFTYVYLSTNGLLCTPERLEKLVEAGIDSIKFSISAASEESFLKHHGTTGFQKVLDNMRYAWEYRKRSGKDYKLFVFSIITNLNRHEVDTMKKLFTPYCDELVMQQAVNMLSFFCGHEGLYAEGKSADLHVPGSILPCSMLFNRIVVTSTGFLSICCYTDLDFTAIADLRECSLHDAFYSEEYQALREKHLTGRVENTICNRCVYGVMESMEPVTSQLGFASGRLDPMDISGQIAEIAKNRPRNDR